MKKFEPSKYQKWVKNEADWKSDRACIDHYDMFSMEALFGPTKVVTDGIKKMTLE